MNLEIEIRNRRDDDEDFIYSSWINTLQKTHPFNLVDKNWFYSAQHGVIDKLLKASDVLVACQPGVEDQVYGYLVVGQGRCLHWLYTKHMFRKEHVATRLMERAFGDFQEGIEFTIGTPAINYHKRRWNLVYKSYRLCEATKGVRV